MTVPLGEAARRPLRLYPPYPGLVPCLFPKGYISSIVIFPCFTSFGYDGYLTIES